MSATLARVRQVLAIGAGRCLLGVGATHYILRAAELTLLGWLLAGLSDAASGVAALGVFRVAPTFLFGALAGGLVDRFSPRTMLRLAQVALVVSTGGVLLLLSLGQLSIWHTYLAAFLSGVGYTGDFSARRAWLSSVLPAPMLVTGIAVDITSLTGSMLVGPAVAGLALAWVGPAGAYVGMVLLVLLAMVLVARLPVPARRLAARAISSWQAVRAILADRRMRAVLLITVIANTVGFPFNFLLPVVARDTLQVGPLQYGLLSSAIGVGALISSILLTGLQTRFALRTFLAGTLLFMTGITALGLSRSYSLSLLVMLAYGLGFSGFAAMQIATTLRAAPPALRGRAMGGVALAIGLQPVGVVGLGALADTIGASPAVAVFGAVGMGLVITVGLAMRLWREEVEWAEEDEL